MKMKRGNKRRTGHTRQRQGRNRETRSVCPLVTSWAFEFAVTRTQDIRTGNGPGERCGYVHEGLTYQKALFFVRLRTRQIYERSSSVQQVHALAEPKQGTHIDTIRQTLTRTQFKMENTQSLLPTAIMLATGAHGSQMNMDKTLYLLHPLRLMMQCKNEDEQIVAILHDAVEDTPLTIDDIRAAGLRDSEFGFRLGVLNAIDLLTKREGQDYQDYLEAISHSRLATKIKLLDLYDNIDVTRLPTIGERDLVRTEKYHNAIRFLEANYGAAH